MSYKNFEIFELKIRVTGGELLQRLLNKNTLIESEIAYCIQQLLNAVNHMHSKMVLHLDLKVTYLPIL